jgi:hypothetical protein
MRPFHTVLYKCNRHPVEEAVHPLHAGAIFTLPGEEPMRIQQLPRENTGMQGPDRRRWYRRHSAEHLRIAQELVTSAGAAVKSERSRRAVVLGAGACTEVPLEWITRYCESVVLVDVDVAGMVRARAELPSSLRGRVQVVDADITGGVSATLADDLRTQPWHDLARLSGSGGLAPVDAAASCLERCPIPDPPVLPDVEVEGGYSIVISSLVLTQLFSLPLLDAYDMLAYHAAGVADLSSAQPRYRAAATSFRRRIALAHLALLERLMAPVGVGLFISDVTGYLLTQRAGSSMARPTVEREALSVLPIEVLALPDEFAKRFTLVESPRYWQWLVALPGANHPGRSYDVCGLLFRRSGS